MAVAKVENYNGYPAIIIDGVPYPPMYATVRTHGENGINHDREYFRNLGKSGIKVFFIMCDTEWTRAGALEEFYDEAKMLLEEVPDAYIMLRIGIHPPKEWAEQNLDELVKFSDGTLKPMSLWNENFSREYPSMYSLSSEKWREDAGKALKETCEALNKSPYSDRIVGYFISAGQSSEWWYNNVATGDAYADHSKAFKKYYSTYLREKYGDDQSLRKAWRMDDASIDDPYIPDLKSRYFVDKVENSILNGPYVSPEEPKPATPHHDACYGTFLNIDDYYTVSDYLRAWHCGTADSIIYFADVIKKNTDNKLVGSFYGSWGGVIVNGSNSACTLRVLDSGKVDLLAAPGMYQNRHLGGFTGQREMVDSFRLRNCIYFIEEDTRTHGENDYFNNFVELYCVEDTLNVMKRDFGRNLCEDVQAWWFDQHVGGGRYKFTEVYDLIKKQQELAKLSYSIDRTKQNEIAFIYDEESGQIVSERTSFEVVGMLRNYEISHIGASVDQYFHNDMANPYMPSYKLYVFCNVFFLTDDERKVILDKLKKDNAVALWIYASGIINPDKDKRFSEKNISELIGINVGILDNESSPKFKINGEAHEITDGLDMGQIYGWNYRLMQNSIENSYLNFGSILYPIVYSKDDDAVNTAYFLENKLPAVSVKEMDGYTSIFYGAKLISSSFIRNVAKFAGCHIFCESDDVIYASRNFVTVHASTSGKKTLYFPKKCSPVEVYEEKTYGKSTDKISFNMLRGETKTFKIYE
ncbi:MAG: hypothetical protein IKJ91_09810 [Clostridia bacterium]|nr:hypothetical protein [Clostridia bacterium]